MSAPQDWLVLIGVVSIIAGLTWIVGPPVLIVCGVGCVFLGGLD